MKRLVFGGDGLYRRLDDVWGLDLTTLSWRELTPPGAAPPPLTGAPAPDRRPRP